MSVNLMAWAFRQDVDPAAKLVLLALADHANGQNGLCIPGQKLLAEQCSMSVRTVQRHLQTLEGRGLIRRQARMRGSGRGRTSDAYYLCDQSDNLGHTVTTNATKQNDQHDNGVVAEPEENRRTKPLQKDEPKKTGRKPDLLFDSLAEVCMMDTKQLTVSSRGQLNRAVKELRDIGATPQQVTDKAATYRRVYDKAALTPTALIKHWPSLPEAKRRTRQDVCPDCYQPLADHDQELHDLNAGRWT